MEPQGAQQPEELERGAHLPQQPPADASAIVQFYTTVGRDSQNRTLDHILQCNDAAWEIYHDYIQWVFPLHEISGFSHDAQILTESDVALLSSSPTARANMARSITRWREFLGISSPKARDKWADWATERNHNLLRITRSIRSIRLFGMEEEARALYEDVMQVSNERPGAISQHTLAYWHRAMQEPAMQPMRQNSGLVMPMAGIWRRFVDAMERMGAADMSDADRQEAEEKLLQELGVSSQR